MLLANGRVEDAVKAAVDLWHISASFLDGTDPEHLEHSLSHHRGSVYTKGLADKYGHRGSLSYWSFMELASFGGVVALYKHWFYDISKERDVNSLRLRDARPSYTISPHCYTVIISWF